MRKTSKIIIVTIIATSILLGLGYAAIQNITLNITGTAAAQASQDNFKVRFTKVSNVSDAVNVTASVSSDTLATMNVTGLTEKGNSVTATYEIENQSADLSSDLKISTTNSNTEYFLISSRLNKSSLVAGEKTTVTVVVEMLKTPIEGSVSSSIGVKLEAMPVEPGKEGTSEGTNDFSQTPEAKNEYGFYFNEAYTMKDVENGYDMTYIFSPDGAGGFFLDGVLHQYIPVGTFEYDTLKVSFSGEPAYFSEDGRKLLIEGEFSGEAILDETFMDRYDDNLKNQNEYGFYFGQAYSRYVEDDPDRLGKIETIIFYEDGSAELYEDGVLMETAPIGRMEYSEYTASCIDFTAVFSYNGVALTINGLNFALDLTFEDKYKIPVGAAYYRYTDDSYTNSIRLKFMPSDVQYLDTYIDGYVYTYLEDGWLASVGESNDGIESDINIFLKDKRSYPAIKETVNGNPVTSLNSSFSNCENLIIAPDIPSTVKDMTSTFQGCVSLKQAPVIPEGVISLQETFEGCVSLEGDVIINASNLEKYANCLDGVDKEKITLKGSAPVGMLNAIRNGTKYSPEPV